LAQAFPRHIAQSVPQQDMIAVGYAQSKEAPLDWIVHQCRRRSLTYCFICSAASLCLGLGWSCYGSIGPGCDTEQSTPWSTFNAFVCVLELASAALICFVDLPGQVREWLVCVAHVALLIASSWNLVSTWHHDLTSSMVWPWFLLGTALSGVRLLPFLLCISVDAAIMAYPVYQESSLPMPSPSLLFHVGACVAVVVVQQFEWGELYDSEQSRNRELEAMETLLSGFCDAKCWLDNSGLVILRADSRLDSIFGQPLLSKRLEDLLPAHEFARFRLATAGSPFRGGSTPVTLINLTFRARAAVAVEAELFIVDRRGYYTPPQLGKNSAMPGFLVGLRLCGHGDAAVPTSQPDGQGSYSQAYFDVGLSLRGCEADLELGDQTPQKQAAEILRRIDEAEAVDSTSDASNMAHGASQQLDAQMLPLMAKPDRSGSLDSNPNLSASPASTLAVDCFPAPDMSVCSQIELEAALADGKICDIGCARRLATLQQAVRLVCQQAEGGALVCIAEAQSFEMVFGSRRYGKQREVGPFLRVADNSYLTRRLRGVHISDPHFVEAFQDFTRHTDNDRWPENFPDLEARGQPKDGAFLISTSGYRLLCAVKLLGLHSPWCWESMGTKHEAALACAWTVPGCCVLVRSEGGETHFINRHGHSLQVRRLVPMPSCSIGTQSQLVGGGPQQRHDSSAAQCPRQPSIGA